MRTKPENASSGKGSLLLSRQGHPGTRALASAGEQRPTVDVWGAFIFPKKRDYYRTLAITDMVEFQGTGQRGRGY